MVDLSVFIEQASGECRHNGFAGGSRPTKKAEESQRVRREA
jgi:hypothetical protein